MLTFLKPLSAPLPRILSPQARACGRGFFRVRRAAPANRLRLVQRCVIAAEKAYLINERAEHKQRMEPGTTCCRGHRTHQYEYADPREIFRSQRSQMVFAFYQGVDHIERFCQGPQSRRTSGGGRESNPGNPYIHRDPEEKAGRSGNSTSTRKRRRRRTGETSSAGRSLAETPTTRT